jgi:hypothetical protein
MQLNDGQQLALNSAMEFLGSPSERYMVIKGRAGTGKSTLTDELVTAIGKYSKVLKMILKQDDEVPLHLSATTNKAAKVLSEMAALPATTIHSLLGLTMRVNWQTGESILIRKSNSKIVENCVIIIDEAFWICPQLLSYLEKGTLNCKIIFIGDPYQCAPVRQKYSPIQNFTCRTEVMRNNGVIQQLGEHWRNAVMTETFKPFAINSPDVIWTTGNEFQYLIDKEYADVDAPESRNKILAWTNKRVVDYCSHVRNLRGLPDTYVEGEYVQINNSLAKQGFATDSIVRIKKFIDSTSLFDVKGRYAELYSCSTPLFIPDSADDYTNVLKQHKAVKDWKTFYEMQDTIPELRSVHSCTVHKSQGSTYDNVFIDLPDIARCNIASDVARIMHVAVTRAKHKVIFRGNLPEKYGG